LVTKLFLNMIDLAYNREITGYMTERGDFYENV